MAVETVTNYKCDRCGRSEITDKVTILTLTIRKRAGKNVPGQGVSEYSAHVCSENCLKIVKASMTPVGKPGQYDRKAAAERRRATTATKPATKQSSTTTGGTKKAQAPASRTKPVITDTDPFNALPAHVRAVRVITRTPNGKFAPGYNSKVEAKMIKEAESKIDSGN